MNVGDGGDACVAGGAMQRGNARVNAEGQANRVLARAAADDEDVHGVHRFSGRKSKLWSRAGPTPITLKGAPDMSCSASMYLRAFFGRSSNSRASEMSSRQPGNSS